MGELQKRRVCRMKQRHCPWLVKKALRRPSTAMVRSLRYWIEEGWKERLYDSKEGLKTTGQDLRPALLT